MSATPEVKKTGIHRKSTNSKSSKSFATVDHSLHATPKPLKTLGSKFSEPSRKVRKSSARADHSIHSSLKPLQTLVQNSRHRAGTFKSRARADQLKHQ